MTEIIIKTDKSQLNLHNLKKDTISLVRRCVDDIKDQLQHNPEIIVYGKKCYQRRSIGFFSNESIGYYYSNKLMRSKKLSPILIQLLNLINNKFNCKFNGILVNYYIDGNEYIGKHSDDEGNLGVEGVIAISYGAIRKFRIRDKKTNKIIQDIPTDPTKIIQMCGDFQKEFTHEIPVEKKVKEPRYSFTFRKHLE